MDKILYVIAGILTAFWLIGYVGFGAGNEIHMLLVMASTAIILNFMTIRRHF